MIAFKLMAVLFANMFLLVAVAFSVPTVERFLILWVLALSVNPITKINLSTL